MRMKRLLLVLLLMAHWVTPAQAQPGYDCSAAGHHHDFDFWLGQWAVTDKQGTPLGQNSISTDQKGCVLNEYWTSAAGNTGQSASFYNPATNKWRQLWIDAGSSIIDIRGGLHDGAMVLSGSIHYFKTAKTHAFRGSWTPEADGSVRQFFEQQDDSGEWKIWFEGIYRRVNTG